MRKQRPKIVKVIAVGHTGDFAQEMMLELGLHLTTPFSLHHTHLHLIYLDSPLVKEFPVTKPPGSMGSFIWVPLLLA